MFLFLRGMLLELTEAFTVKSMFSMFASMPKILILLGHSGFSKLVGGTFAGLPNLSAIKVAVFITKAALCLDQGAILN